MSRYTWITDIHLDQMQPETMAGLLQLVHEDEPDGVWIGGDISQADSLLEHLCWLDEQLQRPIQFVLGNHDFYLGSIPSVRKEVETFCAGRERLTYLSCSSWIPLGEGVGLVGHDGWADGRIGDYAGSTVDMNDYRLIDELSGMGTVERLPVLQRLGDEAAEHVGGLLADALQECRHVYLLTHVPPLRAACWYNEEAADDEWAPHFTCKAMGEMILETMKVHPEKQLTVLCGHTHSAGICQPLPNLEIHTGGAEYDRAEIAGRFQIG